MNYTMVYQNIMLQYLHNQHGTAK